MTLHQYIFIEGSDSRITGLVVARVNNRAREAETFVRGVLSGKAFWLSSPFSGKTIWGLSGANGNYFVALASNLDEAIAEYRKECNDNQEILNYHQACFF